MNEHKTHSTTLKTLGDGWRVGGYLVVFGDRYTKDLHGEYFTPATDFGLDWYEKRPALYHHGLDGTVKASPVGVIDTIKADSRGLWAEAQLDKRHRYAEHVKKLVDAGALNWSSGSVSHLVQKAPDGHIKRWVIVEGSLTPEPAEPRYTDVGAIKSACAELGIHISLEVTNTETPEAPAEADYPALGAADVMTNLPALDDGGIKIMSDAPAIQQELQAFKSQLLAELNAAMAQGAGRGDNIKALEDKIRTLENAMKAAPAYTPDGRPVVKSLGETLQAVKSATLNRRGIADEFAVKSMSGGSGVEGGYLLPERFGTEFLTTIQHQSPVLSRIPIFPVAERLGKFPVANLFGTVTGGNTPTSAGLTRSKRAEGAAHSQKELRFEMIRYSIENAVSGKIPVPKELVRDSPISLEVLLTNAINSHSRSNMEWMVFNGSGEGEPLGIFNSGAVVNVTPATAGTFARVDASNMASRLFVMNDESRVSWAAHRSMMADIDALDANTATSEVVMVGVQARRIRFIKEYPLDYSHFVPVADASGCVMLVDWSAYLLVRKVEATGEGVQISYFDQNDTANDVWTFDLRIDGQPVVRAPIAYSDSYSMSPYVRFND